MTAEHLARLTEMAAYATSFRADDVIALLRHFAALTAERDEALVQAKGHRLDAEALARVIKQVRAAVGIDDDDGSRHVPGLAETVRAVLSERDTLRERVRALETQVKAADRDAATWLRRLCRISQRAVDADGLGLAYAKGYADRGEGEHRNALGAVASYVVGEDGAGAWRCCRGLEACTEADPCTACESVPDATPTAPTTAEHAHSYMAGCNASCPPAEPTTAEDIATVRAGISPLSFDDVAPIVRARDALSLLERRMGAMGRVLSDFVAQAPHAWTVKTLYDFHARAVAALTDAPAVYTLDDVGATCERLKGEPPHDETAYANGWEDALSSVGAALVADRHAALRR